MTKLEIKKKINSLVAEDKLQFAIQFMEEFSYEVMSKETTILLSRLKQLEKEKRMDTIKLDDYNLEKNKIRLSILECAQQLELNGVHKVQASRTKILIDASHQQGNWKPLSPTVEAGFSSAIANSGSTYEWEIGRQSIFDKASLNDVDILVLPPPNNVKLEEKTIDQIRKWVFKGNSLLVFGNYFMEMHHGFNINKLVNPMGIIFQKNLVMPKSKMEDLDCIRQAETLDDKNLWAISPIQAKTDHPILNGIENVALLSSCTVDFIRNFELVVETNDKQNVMIPRGEIGQDERVFPIYEFVKDKTDKVNFLVACKYGKGKVVGIGSWKMFLNDLIDDPSIDNDQLFLNVLGWLSD